MVFLDKKGIWPEISVWQRIKTRIVGYFDNTSDNDKLVPHAGFLFDLP
jgi:hypothetical protein